MILRPTALPVVELDLSKLPEGTPRIAGAEVKWGKGTKAYRDTKSAVAEDLPEESVALMQQTAVAVFQALASKAEFAMAARKTGRTYTQLVGEIAELALARYGS